MSREEILLRLRERIVSFAASQIARESAEDLAQEVLLVLHERYGQVTALEELVPLSMQIMRFKLLAHRRKLVRRGEHTAVSVDDAPLPDLRPGPDEAASRREQLERLKAALARSGERCRELFALKLKGLSFREIQQQMGAGSINTVYTWDLRCRKHLLEALGGSWELP